MAIPNFADEVRKAQKQPKTGTAPAKQAEPQVGQQYPWTAGNLPGMNSAVGQQPPVVTPVLNLWQQPQQQSQVPVSTAPGGTPSGLTFWPAAQTQAPVQQQATMTTKPNTGGTALEQYLEQGGDWGPFGAGKEGYQRWYDEFSTVHTRAPSEQDVVDYWDSVGFYNQNQRGPTDQEWKNRWYSGSWAGGQDGKRTTSRTAQGFDVWSIYPQNPALNWWS